MDSINDIISKLSAEDIEELKDMASEIFGSQNEPVKEEKQPQAPDFSSLFGNAELLSRLTQIMGAMKKEDDKTRFINALKPLLSKDRQKRADEAMQLLKIMDILPLVTSLGGK